MPIDMCKLCLQTKELRDSHMLPSAVWRLLNEPGHKLNHPILMTEKLALTSSRQIHNYVLCADCEQLLNKNGEHYTIAQMRGRRGFPLLDRLRKTTPIASFESVSSYSGSAAGVDTEKLVYFGLSVVWRAGAYKWKNLYSDNAIYFLDLGSFLEPMRQYLLGTAPFPSHITVNVQAASDTQSQWSAYTPAWAAGGRCPVVGFLACGIHFAVAMGNPHPPGYLLACCHNSGEKIIFEKDISGQSTRAFNRLYATTRVVGQLRDR
jgi:hypothetical protein